MRIYKFVVLAGYLIGSCLQCLAVNYSGNPETRSYINFGGSLDKLLLDTPHVYIQADHKVGHFRIEESGLFFIGNISFTAGANMAIVIRDWANWFTVPESPVVIGKEGSETPEDSDEVLKQAQEKLKIAEEKLKTLDKEALEKSKNAKKKIIDADKERLEKIDEHLAAFKKELVTTVIDFGALLKGLSDQDNLYIVLFVKDEAFLTKYNTHVLKMTISYGDLKDIIVHPQDTSKINSSFRFNP